LPGLNTGTFINPVAPPVTVPSIIIPPSTSLPVEHKICMMVMMCMDGKVHTADCGETGNKCYVFQETGNGNCYCIQ
jgi:hypothetical protein